MAARVNGAVNAARRMARAGIEACHGAIPGIAMADKTLAGVTGLRLDATVVPCHSQGRRRLEFQRVRPAPRWAAMADLPPKAA